MGASVWIHRVRGFGRNTLCRYLRLGGGVDLFSRDLRRPPMAVLSAASRTVLDPCAAGQNVLGG